MAYGRLTTQRASPAAGLALLLPLILVFTLLTPPVHADTRMGGQIDVEGPIDEVNVIGGSITIDGPVKENVNAVGGNILLTGSVGGEARLVAGRVRVSATIGKELSVAGGSVTIEPETRVEDDLDIAAGDIELRGVVKGEASLAAGEVTINARIEGDTEIRGEEVDIARSAYFGGDLTIYAPDEPDIPEGVTIEGTYSYKEERALGFRAMPIMLDFDGGRSPALAGITVAWALLVGLVLIFGLPNLTNRVATMLQERPGSSLLYGFGFLILVPIVGVLLIMTIIGIPIGLMVFLAYPFLLVFGYVFAGLAISRAAFSRQNEQATKGQMALGLVLVLIGIAILSILPIIGGLISLLLLIAGTGAFGAVLLYGENAYAPDGTPKD